MTTNSLLDLRYIIISFVSVPLDKSRDPTILSTPLSSWWEVTRMVTSLPTAILAAPSNDFLTWTK